MKSRLHLYGIVDVMLVYSSSKEALTTPFRRSALLKANSLLKYLAIWINESYSSLVNKFSPFPNLRPFILDSAHPQSSSLRRCTVIKNLANNQVLVIMNLALKFSLVGYQETQRKWFGIMGRSLHVSVAVNKRADGEVEVEL